MTLGFSRAVMTLATCCLGESRRDWALAMEGEFDAATREGRPLAFATGCLITAWREMPKHQDGRLVLASYALALGLLIPMAVFPFACAIGLPQLSAGRGILFGMATAGGEASPYLTSAQMAAVPALLLLWLLLGVGRLCLAWVLVEGDWSRALNIGALIAAVTVTLYLLMGVLFLDGTPLIPPVVELAIELTVILVAARRDSQLSLNGSAEVAAWSI
jgi:hypothetical protein